MQVLRAHLRPGRNLLKTARAHPKPERAHSRPDVNSWRERVYQRPEMPILGLRGVLSPRSRRIINLFLHHLWFWKRTLGPSKNIMGEKPLVFIFKRGLLHQGPGAVAGFSFGGGGKPPGGPRYPPPKTEKSSDLAHYFLKRAHIHKIKK